MCVYDEKIESFRKEFDGFNFKHKQAISILDSKNNKAYESMQQIEK